MPQLAIDDVNLANTPVEGREASLHFGNHPTTDDALLDQRLGFRGRHRMDHTLWIVFVSPDTIDIADKNQLFCP